MVTLKTFLILFFIVGLIFADDFIEQTKKSSLFAPFTCSLISINYLLNSSDSLIKLAFAFVAVLIAVVYMLGNILKNPNLILWAKNELVNFFWSAVLILIVGVALSISCLSIVYFASGAYPENFKTINSPTDIILNYLQILMSSGRDHYFDLLSSSLDNIFDSTETIVVSDGGFLPWTGSGGISYNAGKREWAAYKEMLGMYLASLLGSIYAQYLLFSNLFPLILSFVLPTGIFLRIIPIFRDVGDFLIALSIVLYLFLPTFYLIMLASIQKTQLNSWLVDPQKANEFIDLYDALVSDNLIFISYLSIHAIFIPNLLLVLVVTASMELYKAIKGFFS